MIEHQIIEITKLSDIEKIKDDWTELLNLTHSKNLYVDPDFYERLFNSRANNGIPKIVLFKKKNTPVAILVGWRSKIKVPLWLGYKKFYTKKIKSLEIEIGGLITNGEAESKTILLDYLQRLIKNKDIELILANHFSTKNPFYEDLKNGLFTDKNAIFKRGKEWSSIIRDADTGNVVNIHSSWTGQTFRRKDKKILKHFEGKLEIKTIKSCEQISEFVKHAEKISQKSYHLALGVGIENSEYWNKMFTAMASGGYFRGYLLMSGETPIAYYQGVAYKDIFYAFTTSYDASFSKLSPGSFLLRRVIEICSKEELNVFHFGYGDAEHKQLYGNDSLEEASIKIYGITISARIFRLLDYFTVYINEKLLTFLDKRGWLKKIKKFWRTQLRKK